jgi:hypothetical protein
MSQDRLKSAEKVAFAIAAVFSGVILLMCMMLVMVGFVFSPIADTLVFGILMTASGLTSYAIWRGGR